MSVSLAAKHPKMNSANLLGGLLVMIAYVVTGKLGMLLALAPDYASPIFLPAGIAVAAVLIGGARTLPWIFIAALIVAGQSNPAAALVIAAASTMQALCGGWLLRRVLGYPTMLDQKREVLSFLVSVPLICLVSAGISMLGLWALGIVEGESLLRGFATWWVGDTLGVMVMFPISMIVAGEPRALWRSRLLSVAIPMLLILATFVVIYLKACELESTESLAEFREISKQSVYRIQDSYEEQTSLLEQVNSLFIHQPNELVSRQEFHRFVQKSLQRFSMIQALEWVPYVASSDRVDFVAEQRKDIPDFNIRERTANGSMQDATVHESYYPVTYLEPHTGNDAALGFDLASNAVRKASIDLAIRTGVTVASGAVKLVQEKQQQSGVLLIAAVKPKDNQSALVLTVLRVGDFMEKILENGRELLYTRLIDVDDQQTLYSNFADDGQKAIFTRDFDFGTRHYRLETAPTAVYYARHPAWESWFVLVIGNLFAGLFGAFLLVDTGHTARIESQVIERTRKLKESESRFHFMLENSPIAVRIVTLSTGRVVFANQAYAELINQPANQLIGVNPASYYAHPQEYEEIIARLGRGEQVTNRLVELSIPNAADHRKWTLASYLQLEFEQQPAIMGWFYDITEQKRGEERIQTLVNEQKAMLENDLVGIVRVSDRVILWANPSFEKMLGYERGEMVGLPTRTNFVDAEAYEALGKAAYPVLLAGGIYRVQMPHRRKDGSVIWVDMSGSMLDLETGESMWAFLDITERKAAEEKLRYSEQRFRDVSNASGEYLWEIDVNMVYTYVSSRVIDVKGYTPAQLLGHTPMEFMVEEDVEAVGAIVNQAIAHRAPFKLQHRDIAQDGRVLWEAVNGVPICDAEGKVIGLRGTGLNITERKNMEDQVHLLAFYDALTGLPNRRLLDERLAQALASSRRTGCYGALMFLDLDNFKPLNDTYGHAVGDLLLIEAAKRLKHCVREIDAVARFGGDEFVALLNDLKTDQEESMLHAAAIAEKIRISLSTPYFLKLHTEGGASVTVEHRCTVSIGVALFGAYEGGQDELMKWADAAMYQAKAAGRNSIRFYGRDA